MNIVYPTGAFTPAGGPVINMKSTTKFTPNAVGDGVTDDTAAFVSMMNFLKAELATARAAGRRFSPWIIYVPSGTYLVSDTIFPSTVDSSSFTGLNLIGQNRVNTTIRLKNNSVGFGAGANKPVIQFTDPALTANGGAWGNELRNLTINTGSGNPGAVGVIFLGANTCNLDNLTVTSGDGFGASGLSFPTWSVQGHFSDITVSGFDYGINCNLLTEQNPGLEYVTLSNQKKAGIYVGGSHPTIRKLQSNNSVPAIRIEGSGSHVLITDSTLTGTGAAGSAAIRMNETAAGSATLTSGWSGRSRDNLGVSGVDNWKITRTPSGGSATVVTIETFEAGSGIASAADFDSAFDFYESAGNRWNYGGGGTGGGFMVGAPGGASVGVVRKAPYSGFQTGTTITLSLDARMRGTGVSTNSIPFKALLKDVPAVAGISGLDFECNNISGASTNRFSVRANGLELGTLDLAASIAANNVWWYRWTASWTRLASGNYDMTLKLEDIGATGTTAPVTVQTWSRSNFAAAVKAQLFARNVASTGYTSTLEIDNKAEVTGNVGYDFISGGTYRFGTTSPLTTMNLPVDEAVLVPWESNPANWASPEDYTGTVIQKIQAAMNSGKPAVYFPRAYTITDSTATGTITIPSTVKQIDWMGQQKHSFANSFEPAASTNPLWIEHASGNARLRMTTNRPINARTGDLRIVVTTTNPITIHYQNMYLNESALDSFCPANATVFARSINQENSSTFNFLVNGGKMRVMGFKTEQSKDSFYVKNGGYLEVLGGYRNLAGQTNSSRPWIYNDNSNVSVIGTTFGQQLYTDAIWEKRGTVTTKYFPADLPKRPDALGQNTYFIPHYSGYTPLPSADVTYDFSDTTNASINGIHGGINFGSGAWWGGKTWLGMSVAGFMSSGITKSFTLPAGKKLKSIRLSSAASGSTYSISDGINPTVSGTFAAAATPIVVTTGWTSAGAVVTFTFSNGGSTLIDDVVYN